MDMQAINELFEMLLRSQLLTSPLIFAALSGLAVMLFWLALSPSQSEVQQGGRLEGYLRGDIVEDVDMQRSFLRRAVIPFIQRTLKTLASLTPQRDVEKVQQMLIHAGQPLGLTAVDVLGLQILSALACGGIYLAVSRLLGQLTAAQTLVIARNTLLLALVGFFLPRLWLRLRVNSRKREILRNFPDALDLLSVSVDAGLAFDSAMVRVAEQWDNALTREFNRAIVEMRVGTQRNVALQRMADRTGVQDVQTFVGVLIQSSQLGVSIAETLHNQAAQVRVRRRQRAEELARQASIKMVFALVFFIFPALLVVLLGPGVPRIFEALGNL
ncbi:MAG: type II secretion system F family protein [Anaerolineae bacterium]